MKLIRVIAFFLGFSSPAAVAWEWPWSGVDVERTEYCKGVVMAGLSSPFITGNERRDLWLAWNYLIRTDGAGHAKTADNFEQGRGVFAAVTDTESATARLREIRSDCGLGRSGWQISGW